jgi:hypothetical protein
MLPHRTPPINAGNTPRAMDGQRPIAALRGDPSALYRYQRSKVYRLLRPVLRIRSNANGASHIS